MPFHFVPSEGERIAVFGAIVGAIGAIWTWLRNRPSAEAELAKSDAEIGKALRDELRGEIDRMRETIEEQDQHCQKRLDAMNVRLIGLETENTHLRESLGKAEALIATLKRQVAALSKQAAA